MTDRMDIGSKSYIYHEKLLLPHLLICLLPNWNVPLKFHLVALSILEDRIEDGLLLTRTSQVMKHTVTSVGGTNTISRARETPLPLACDGLESD